MEGATDAGAAEPRYEPPSWGELLEVLEGSPGPATTYVLGGVDAGKSTLCGFFVEGLRPLGPVALVDGDPGQSSIGPPATVGSSLGGAQALTFVGSTSPTGHLLQTVVGVKRLTERSLREGAAAVVCDSPGMVEGDVAREFQLQLIDLLAPDHLVVLQRGDELEPLLAVVRRRRRPRVHRLEVAPAARPRSAEVRRRYREARFAAAFAGALPQTLDLEAAPLHGRVPVGEAAGRGRLAALLDADGFVLSLARLEGLDPIRRQLQVWAPPIDPARVGSVAVGALELDRGGRER